MNEHSKAAVIVCASDCRSDWRWISEEPDILSRADWQFYLPKRENYPRILSRLADPLLTLSCLQAVLALRRNPRALLVSHGPRATLRCAFFARLLGIDQTRHIAWSFNYVELPQGLTGWVARRLFPFVSAFFVYSRMERELYANAFGIPVERFHFQHWGVSSVPRAPSEHLRPAEDYVCAIGGNGRDYELLMRTMEQLPGVKLVLICRPENRKHLKIPANVQCHCNLSPGQCYDILAHSRFMVLPLSSSRIPVGHVTLAAAMLLGKAQVVSGSSGVDDYVTDGVNALVFEAGNATQCAQAIKRLSENPDLAEKLGQHARQFAAKNLTLGHSIATFKSLLTAASAQDSAPGE